MTIEKEDFKQYDLFKNLQGSKTVIDKIMKERTMFNSIFYWDNTFDNVMLDFDLEKQDTEEILGNITKLKKVHEVFKKGYLEKNDKIDSETFNLLQEHLIASAYRYYLIRRRPFILLQVKYNKLDEFEVKCIFEYLIHTNLYLNAVRHKDIIIPIKLGWWTLKDIIEKYKNTVKLGRSEYEYEGEYKW